jgi:hypothetical protein
LRKIIDERKNYSLKNVINSFLQKIQSFILGKETLPNSNEINEINEINEMTFFRNFENNQINPQFKDFLEQYFLYLNKTSLYFFDQNDQVNNINLYQKIYIWIFLIQDFYYCSQTIQGSFELKNKLLKLVHLFNPSNSTCYQNLLLPIKNQTITTHQKIQKEELEFLGNLLLFVLLEPLALKKLNPRQFANNYFLSILRLEQNQINLLNCLGILNIAVTHPYLEYNKTEQTVSSIGINPNKKSVLIPLRGIHPVILIQIKNTINTYQNYSWFSLSIYEALRSIHKSFIQYYNRRFKKASYKIRLFFKGLMFKYEDQICGASNIDFMMNLKFDGSSNSYVINDQNKENLYLNSTNVGELNFCEGLVKRLSFLLKMKYHEISVEKDTKTVSFHSPKTKEDNNYSERKENTDKEFHQMIDQWDSLWQIESESSANIFILNQVDVTIYEISSFPYTTNEVFFPMNIDYVGSNLQKKLVSVLLSQNFTKMLNSSLNLYTVFLLNTVFGFEDERFEYLTEQYNTKLYNMIKDPIIYEISQNAFNKNLITNQWKVFLEYFLEMNDVELVKFLKTIRKMNEF